MDEKTTMKDDGGLQQREGDLEKHRGQVFDTPSIRAAS